MASTHSDARARSIVQKADAAKFELNELPARLLGGPTEVKLNERELNALLFGDLRHEEGGEKARVLIEGDALRFHVSKPIEDAPEPKYYNVTALLRVSAGPESAHLTLVEGQVGDYTLGPVTRPMVEKQLRQALSEKYRRDARLNRIRAMSVESGQVILTYEPKPR